MKLIIEDDEGRKTVVPFLREEITIGRQEGNTIRLTERNVSRRHCKLVRSNGSIWVEDLGSYNGVRVNGDRVEGKQPIKPGDLIEVGDYDLAIEGDGAAAEPNGAAAGPAAGGGDDTRSTMRMAAPVEAAEPAALSMQPTRAASGPKDPHKFEPTSVIKAPVSRGDRKIEAVPADKAPRLVALTTEHAGKEFVLDKTVIGIGKGPENEVSVDHRSVSRNHCQVVRDADGTWKVLDLQSANGVKVNGEPYGEAPLRAGDTLQLGHLRFRFVGPGEVFQFVPEPTTGVTQALPSPRSKLPLIGAIAGVVLLGGGVGIAALAGAFSGDAAEVDPPAVAAAGKDPAPKPEAPKPDGAKPEGTKVGEPKAPDEVAAVAAKPDDPPLIPAGTKELAEAEKAFGEKRWKDAEKLADAAVNAGAGEKAEALLDKARAEQEAQAAFAAAQKAVNKGDGQTALDELDKVPQDSALQADAKPLRFRAGVLYVQEVVKESRALVRQKRFDDARAVLDEADVRVPNDPGLEKARAELDKAEAGAGAVAARVEKKDRAATPASGRRDRSDADEESSKGPGAEDEAASKREEAKRSFETGVGLASKGQCKQAIPAFHKSLQLNPALAESHKYLGTCYAQLGDGDNGAKHYRKFLELQPNHPQAPQIRKILDQYEEYQSKKGG